MPAIHPQSRLILALFEERNITRAARRAGMQQPGLSKILGRVEAELGQPLFIRVKDGLVPTAFGQRFARELRQVQELWDGRLRELRAGLDRVEGTYRVGCHPVIAGGHLAQAIARFHRDHPAARIELALQPSVEVVDRVLRSELEFGMVANPARHPELVISRIAREHVALWARGELDDEGPVYYNPDMIGVQAVLRRLGRRHPIPVRDYALIAACAAAEPGQAALLPNGVASRTPGLRQVSSPFYHSDICVVHRADLPRTRGTLAVLEALKRRAKSARG